MFHVVLASGCSKLSNDEINTNYMEMTFLTRSKLQAQVHSDMIKQISLLFNSSKYFIKNGYVIIKESLTTNKSVRMLGIQNYMLHAIIIYQYNIIEIFKGSKIVAID